MRDWAKSWWNVTDGLTILSIMAIAGPLVNLVIAQLSAWSGLGAWVDLHFTGAWVGLLKTIPTWVMVFAILSVIGLAFPAYRGPEN